jgi:hypothetical protein
LSSMSIETPIQGRKLRLGPELNTTPVAGANDTVAGAGTQHFTFFTLPTSAAFYSITGIEWLNGTVVNGNVNTAIYKVDANPPSSAIVQLLVFGAQVVQSGAEAVQRNSAIVGPMIPGGTVCGVMFDSSSATGRFGTTTVASGNNSKTISSSADYTLGNSTAWTATTEEPYIKVYYKAVL